MIFYTSDLHFFNDRIIGLCNRPYKNMNEMIDIIIYNWNRKVSKDDSIYILGDLSCEINNDLLKILSNLNGNKYLIIGNHDEGLEINKKVLRYFVNVDKLMTIKDNGRDVTLCHYPLLSFKESTRHGYHVYGHVHNNTNEPNFLLLKTLKNSFNASLDVNDFEPKTLDELIRRT